MIALAQRLKLGALLPEDGCLILAQTFYRSSRFSKLKNVKCYLLCQGYSHKNILFHFLMNKKRIAWNSLFDKLVKIEVAVKRQHYSRVKHKKTSTHEVQSVIASDTEGEIPCQQLILLCTLEILNDCLKR